MVLQLETYLENIQKITDLKALEEMRVHLFGKKGVLTEALKALSNLSLEEKKQQGSALNVLKQELQTALNTKKEALETAAIDAALLKERIDLTGPLPLPLTGCMHPITQTMQDIIAIFGSMGFAVAEGPDIEDEYYNFTALNISEHHPARQMMDTFYMNDHLVLRTHTSPVQIRTMKTEKPPIRIIAPGRTYRCDYDMTHTPMFHQVEGLLIDETTNLRHLKGCLTEFCRKFFEIPDLTVRFRASYFPFTEPSCEMDILCDRSQGKLKLGEGNDWLEILGCGMVHPFVLQECGIDPEVYQGFAFGMGIERITMLKYGIPDLRTFFENNEDWLAHYGFSPFAVPSILNGN